MGLQYGDLRRVDGMLDRLEAEYGFDDFTPMSEAWNYFELTELPVKA